MDKSSKEKFNLNDIGTKVSTQNYKPNGTSKIPDKSDESEEDELIIPGNFGWFGWEPKWLQWANNATCFMVLMTITNIFQSGTTNGLMGAAQSSIEKRFQLTSTQSSWIIIAYEIATVPLAVFVTYVGTIGCHRPRWTTGFLFISCLGCFVYALPHFTTPVYLPSGNLESDDMLCRMRNSTEVCEDGEDTTSIQAYMAVFIFGRIGLAFGGTGLYNFAVTYLDDSLTRDKFSLYTSMLALGGVVGPALGFILGGYLLSIYTDFPSVDVDNDLDFDQNDPRWVGAWWLGYIIAGFGLILATLPMTGYPRDLPGAEEKRLQKVNEAFGTTEDPSLTNLKFDFTKKELKRFTIDVFTNWSFIWLTLFVCCDMAIISGFTVFGPKYAEVQFSLTAGEAGVLFGLLVVPAGSIGAVSGGLIIERLKLTYTGIVKTEFFTSILVFFMGIFIFLVYCEPIDFAGVNVEYENSTRTEIALIDSCNMNCSCESLQFSPVCSHNEVQYFSACHAGCKVVEETVDDKFYTDCSCISHPPLNQTSAVGGICSTDSCSTELGIFCVTLFVAMVGLFMCEAMNISSVIRVVPNSHRLFAMMCEGFIVRFLGTMPGPMIFGTAFDTACTLWQTDCNGNQGSCYHYDNSYLGYYMIATAGSMKLASCFFMFLAWKMYKPPPAIVEEKIVDVDENQVKTDSQFHEITQNGDVNKNSFSDEKSNFDKLGENNIAYFFDVNNDDREVKQTDNDTRGDVDTEQAEGSFTTAL